MEICISTTIDYEVGDFYEGEINLKDAYNILGYVKKEDSILIKGDKLLNVTYYNRGRVFPYTESDKEIVNKLVKDAKDFMLGKKIIYAIDTDKKITLEDAIKGNKCIYFEPIEKEDTEYNTPFEKYNFSKNNIVPYGELNLEKVLELGVDNFIEMVRD